MSNLDDSECATLRPIFAIEVTTRKVPTSLKRLKANAIGIDNINVHGVRTCMSLLKDNMHHSFNFCIENSIIPTQKTSFIISLPKMNNMEIINGLSPSVFFSFYIKVFERYVEGQLREFVIANNTLPCFQSGLKVSYPSTLALAHVV
ncbi:hypothetical protein Trydic_g11239 [Trypoxylus dichotomus]